MSMEVMENLRSMWDHLLEENGMEKELCLEEFILCI